MTAEGGSCCSRRVSHRLPACPRQGEQLPSVPPLPKAGRAAAKCATAYRMQRLVPAIATEPLVEGWAERDGDDDVGLEERLKGQRAEEEGPRFGRRPLGEARRAVAHGPSFSHERLRASTAESRLRASARGMTGKHMQQKRMARLAMPRRTLASATDAGGCSISKHGTTTAAPSSQQRRCSAAARSAVPTRDARVPATGTQSTSRIQTSGPKCAAAWRAAFRSALIGYGLAVSATERLNSSASNRRPVRSCISPTRRTKEELLLAE